MREILFRGKRLDNGEWVEGNLFIPDNPDTPTQICIGTNIVRITYDVDPSTIGQYTGLTDKNGKKIFEGNILACIISDYDGNKYVRYIITDITNFASMGFLEICHELEVIGNIHNNPELLR